MSEQMQVGIRLFGQESFADELDYLLSVQSSHAKQLAPALAWRKARESELADATFIQGSAVQKWGRTQRLFHSRADERAPDLSRLFAILGPTLNSVSANVRCDPRSRDALIALWESWATEMEPLHLRFCLGQRSFELLSRMSNHLTSVAQYHLEHEQHIVVALQPASGQLYVSPQAYSSSTTHAQWRRRSASAQPTERFEQLPVPLALGIYCQRTTRRLFSNRLRAAHISMRKQAIIRLADHSDQVLAILVHLQAGHDQFAEIAQHLQIDEHHLGNALLGLYLCGIVELSISASMSTLFAPVPRRTATSTKVQTLKA
jgi:hypothetical protein